MICPNCEREMVNKSQYYWSIADWDSDAPSNWVEQHICKKCGIEYLNGDWNIPARYNLPTLKQIKTIYFINRILRTDEEPITRKQCWRFINANFEMAKKIVDKNYDYYYFPDESEL